MSPDEVLAFWFGEPPEDEADLLSKAVRWFRGGPELDREVTARFGGAVEVAVAGGLTEWEAEPRETLALVLLLDQLTRNVFRNSPRMFDGDARAQRLALAAFADGSAQQLRWVERLFLSLPLLHSESLALHERDLEIAKSLAAEARLPWTAMSPMRLEQSGKYLDVVRRFGRFPHRNALLARASTPEEVEFLADWEAKRPPAGMPQK
jgi:uncharacterized protein (DUF924 family)